MAPHLPQEIEPEHRKAHHTMSKQCKIVLTLFLRLYIINNIVVTTLHLSIGILLAVQAVPFPVFRNILILVLPFVFTRFHTAPVDYARDCVLP
jgi:hypothetical protein